MTEALQRFKNPCKITIHAANEWALNMLVSQLHWWAKEDFLNAKGEPISFQDEWRWLWELTKEYDIAIQPGKHTYSSWLKEQMEKGNGTCLINSEK